eukprot:Skav202563  [mRNA]  locus=scaffold2177:172423:173850:- [translate_table: standard]
MSEEDFKKVQQRLCERLISEEKFCDAVAILGPEGRRKPFIRAHLAALSEPLCAALYGDFKEATTREITLPDINEEAFDVLLRTSHNLDPKLSPESAISTLQAAKLYLIEGLGSYCLQYLETLDMGLQLRAMTAALKMSYTLPAHIVLSFCKQIMLQRVQSSTLREAHGSIIHALIQQDTVDIGDESSLWKTLLEWSALAVRKPELLGPFGEAAAALEKCTKRARNDSELEGGLGSHELAQRESVVRMISKHMCFAVMTKEFFFDNVRTWLTREESDAVIGCLCLGRALPEVFRRKREGMFNIIFGGGYSFPAVEIEIAGSSAKATSLTVASWQPWKLLKVSSGLKVSMPKETKVPDKVVVQLTFHPEGSMSQNWGVAYMQTSSVDFETVDKSEPVSFQSGRSLYFELNLTNLKHPVSFGIFPRLEKKGRRRIPFPKNAAELSNVTVFAPKKPEGPTLTEMADRLSSSIFGPISTQ